MIKKALLLGALYALSACQSVPDEPYYAQPIVDVGYMAAFDYWQPIPERVRTKNAARRMILQKLAAGGHLNIVEFDYEIDSNGDVFNVRLLRTVPDNLITQEEFTTINHAHRKYLPTQSNPERTPVRVKQRRIMMSNGDFLLPPDDVSIDEKRQELIDSGRYPYPLENLDDTTLDASSN
ncbi:hypothetical protein [Pseudoalteromonas sp. GB56]